MNFSQVVSGIQGGIRFKGIAPRPGGEGRAELGRLMGQAAEGQIRPAQSCWRCLRVTRNSQVTVGRRSSDAERAHGRGPDVVVFLSRISDMKKAELIFVWCADVMQEAG